MEGFNDVWAHILNGDIINNSENISEHPSLAINNHKFSTKKGDLSGNHHMMGDISVINHNEAVEEKTPGVMKAGDISKEEGQLLEEITAVLEKPNNESTQKVKIEDQKENDKVYGTEEDRSENESNGFGQNYPGDQSQEKGKVDKQIKRESFSFEEEKADNSKDLTSNDISKGLVPPSFTSPNKMQHFKNAQDSKQKAEEPAILVANKSSEDINEQSKENL